MPSEYSTQRGSSTSEQHTNIDWYLFNDMAVTRIWQQQVSQFNATWKHPVAVLYKRTTLDLQPREAFQNPISEAIFNSMRHSTISRVPRRPVPANIAFNYAPKKGDLIAIDAEFVALSTVCFLLMPLLTLKGRSSTSNGWLQNSCVPNPSYSCQSNMLNRRWPYGGTSSFRRLY